MQTNTVKPFNESMVIHAAGQTANGQDADFLTEYPIAAKKRTQVSLAVKAENNPPAIIDERNASVQVIYNADGSRDMVLNTSLRGKTIHQVIHISKPDYVRSVLKTSDIYEP